MQIFSLRQAPGGGALHAEAAQPARRDPLLAVSLVVAGRRAESATPLHPAGALRTAAGARASARPGAAGPFLARSMVLFPLAVRWGMELRAAPVDRIHAHWATHPSTAAWIMSRDLRDPVQHDGARPRHLPRPGDAAVQAARLGGGADLHAREPRLPATALPRSSATSACVSRTTASISPRTGRPATPAEVFRILSVGTLLPRKGFDTLLEACAILQREGTAYACEIVGDGPMRLDLERQARRLGLASVTFLGKRSQEELPEIYRRASVFVLAANHAGGGVATATARRRPGAADLIHFGIPNVILEAMACGLPVVASGLPALKEVLVEDGNGARRARARSGRAGGGVARAGAGSGAPGAPRRPRGGAGARRASTSRAPRARWRGRWGPSSRRWRAHDAARIVGPLPGPLRRHLSRR